jgi:SSS family solute:Na+ symporter/sodium/pantothenate symporter
MLVVAFLIAGAALRDLGGPAAALDALRAQDASLVALTNPHSLFYRHWVEVLVAPFAIGFALVAQPHLLVKALYLKDGKDMAKFSLVGGGCFVVFSLVLLSGLAARVELGADLPQDAAASAWIAQAFPPAMGAFVSVAVLAAAMSTLDGLLVAVSAIAGADLVGHPAVARRLGIADEGTRQRAALNAGRAAVAVLGLVSWLVAANPPALVGIFGTVGTYGLLVASLPALVWGVLLRRPPSALGVGVASLLGLGVHLGLCGWHWGTAGNWNVNTGLTALAGLVVAMPAPFVVDAVRALLGRPAFAVAAPAEEPKAELVAA